TVLLSGLYVTLATLSGQSDIVVGTPSDNRHHSQTQSLIGLFVNSLPLRAQVDVQADIADLIKQVHHTVTQAKVHQELPFQQLVDALGVDRDSSRHPVFQVMFSFENARNDSEQLANLPFTPQQLAGVKSLYSAAKFDLSLFLSSTAGVITGYFNFAVKLFDESSIERMAAMYHRVLQLFCQKNANRSIGQLDFLSKQQRHTLLHDWASVSAKADTFDSDSTLFTLFEQQVARTPDATALVFEGDSLSYLELNEKANQLAHHIRATYKQQYQVPVKPDTLVALYLDRSLDMVTAILAVIKAGGAYVPVSPQYPASRTGFILGDTQAPLLLTQLRHVQALTDNMDQWAIDPGLICVDDTRLYDHLSVANLNIVSSPADLAYVIYTSGTTCKPKGVMISHQNTVHLANAQIERFGLNECKRGLLFAAYVFDACVFELFVSLFRGMTLYLCSEEQRNSAEAVGQLLKEAKIEVATLPPALLSLMDEQALVSLKTLISAGEAPSAALLERISPSCRVFNAYGPTEITVCATAHLFQAGDLSTNIGKSLANTRVYVLDECLRPVPVGSPGELYVGGPGLARGYLNRAELTGQAFVDSPFSNDDKLYKTGDIVRWLPDGNIDYLGRKDFQVKIRGYRVELGEIESVLCAQSQVKQAVVVKSKDLLAAYVVSCSESVDFSHLQEQLREQLSEVLPTYMVPSTFTQIDVVPLTINGKLDKRALPDPELVDGQNYVPPRNALERQLCDVWQTVLEVAQ
ncbi:MAG: amino acid adenylation domain-containing protein, partial [Psychrosphaera sp.]|nr:amino acid adenylation domain-containing protein [Psychrosphaera sp.]